MTPEIRELMDRLKAARGSVDTAMQQAQAALRKLEASAAVRCNCERPIEGTVNGKDLCLRCGKGLPAEAGAALPTPPVETSSAPTPGPATRQLRSGTVNLREIGWSTLQAIMAGCKSTKSTAPELVTFWEDSSTLALTLKWPMISGSTRAGILGEVQELVMDSVDLCRCGVTHRVWRQQTGPHHDKDCPQWQAGRAYPPTPLELLGNAGNG